MAEVKYIFETKCFLTFEQLSNLRAQIKQQLDEGLLLLSPLCDYLGREIEVDGVNIVVKFVGEESQYG